LYRGKFLEGLYDLLKINLCCYNILKIKNILIKSIQLSFPTKTVSQKIGRFLDFSIYFPPFKAITSPRPSKLANKS
jgi:hypothetical protein